MPVAQMATMPVQLLARIMALLTPRERLQSAALVSTSWKAAAIMATNSISINCVSQQQAMALPTLAGWLSAHGADAAVRSIHAVQDTSDDVMVLLQLPTEQLQGLEELRLCGVTYAPLQDSSSSSSSPDLPPNAPALVLSDLTALTGLELSYCQGQLVGLSSCTGLQRLVARAAEPPELAFRAEHLAEQLLQALPELTALTQLVLGGPTVSRDNVVQQASGLPGLQDLTLVDSSCSASSFQQLPRSLTALSFGSDISENLPEYGPVISPSATPGICQLTALRKLCIQHVDSFSLEVLTGLTSLEELTFCGVEFKEPGTLSVLTVLTQLKHLELPRLSEEALLPTTADVAAATSSSQLTYLDISEAFHRFDQHPQLFPEGRQLPHLVELRANMSLMDRSAGRAAAACCPNLQRLRLLPDHKEAPVDPMGEDEEAWGLGYMLSGWHKVQSLTCLIMDAGYTPMDGQVWGALRHLTQLRKLEVNFLNISYLPGMLSLDASPHLEELVVEGSDPELFEDVRVSLMAQIEPDGSTNIHKRLPQALQEAAFDSLAHFGQHPKLVKTLLEIAADAQREQQKAHERLQAQVDGLQQQVQAGAAQQVVLEQRYGELQASLAAVLRQLQDSGGAAL